MTHLVGHIPTKNDHYFQKIAQYDIRKSKTERDETRFAISNRNSMNMFKHIYFTGMSAVGVLSTAFLDLRLEGLSKELARNKEIDLILKELGCAWNSKLD